MGKQTAKKIRPALPETLPRLAALFLPRTHYQGQQIPATGFPRARECHRAERALFSLPASALQPPWQYFCRSRAGSTGQATGGCRKCVKPFISPPLHDQIQLRPLEQRARETSREQSRARTESYTAPSGWGHGGHPEGLGYSPAGCRASRGGDSRVVLTAGKHLKNVNTQEGKGLGWERRNRRRVVQGSRSPGGETEEKRRRRSEGDEAEGGEGQEDLASAWCSPGGQKPPS